MAELGLPANVRNFLARVKNGGREFRWGLCDGPGVGLAGWWLKGGGLEGLGWLSGNRLERSLSLQTILAVDADQVAKTGTEVPVGIARVDH